ncbi:MAG: carboxypeptidase regulatory-like domain-containing protein [Bacteroidetes bacterium]|nr:carboxypeptidase regulatory-like domain-containing protein [Bacteroidota bacterium]MBS1648561.1 carboxypeptidase regulatory-like domain-containing protein [Bacteroidota bacterium]
MKKNIYILVSVVLFLSCSSTRRNKSSNAKSFQGIEGYVVKVVGNQMPMVDAPPSKPQPVITTVFIYDSTNIKEVTQVNQSPFYSNLKTRLITTVQSDSLGHFSVSLPEGKYSLFVKVKGMYYANLYDEKNNIFLVTVEKNKPTKVEIKLSNEAVF